MPDDTGTGTVADTRRRSKTRCARSRPRSAPTPPSAKCSDDTNLLVSTEAKLSYNDVVKPTIAQLTITSGDDAGPMFPLTEAEYLIGRQRDNQIPLADLGVSGHHARIYRGPDGYVIEDLKSRNGTWLNGARIFHALLQAAT